MRSRWHFTQHLTWQSTRCLMLLLAVMLGRPVLANETAATGFASFHAQFRAAVSRQDSAAIAALTHLPFLIEGRALDRADFERAVPGLFTAFQRRCLAKAPALQEGDRHVVFCTPYAFYFGRVAGHYRFLEFAADGEDSP